MQKRLIDDQKEKIYQLSQLRTQQYENILSGILERYDEIDKSKLADEIVAELFHKTRIVGYSFADQLELALKRKLTEEERRKIDALDIVYNLHDSFILNYKELPPIF